MALRSILDHASALRSFVALPASRFVCYGPAVLSLETRGKGGDPDAVIAEIGEYALGRHQLGRHAQTRLRALELLARIHRLIPTGTQVAVDASHHVQLPDSMSLSDVLALLEQIRLQRAPVLGGRGEAVAASLPSQAGEVAPPRDDGARGRVAE